MKPRSSLRRNRDEALQSTAATRTCWYHLEINHCFSTKTDLCYIIKVECCIYNPDLSGYISATLDDMKGQVKLMSDDNLPFWTSVLCWVKGDWWKTIFTIVIVALIVLLCGP